jgi:sigma-54 dependent transcriptional regulator, acetoin dehydrogenase operon transcriptional activator AcoR
MANSRGISHSNNVNQASGFALLLSDNDGQRQSELVELLYGGTLALSADGTVIDADHLAATLLDSGDPAPLLGRRIAEIFSAHSAAVPPGQTSSQTSPIRVNGAPARRRVYFISLNGAAHLNGSSSNESSEDGNSGSVSDAPRVLTPRSLSLEELAGGDPQMLRNARTARRVADSDLPILIQGPTGSGKEAFAHAVHSVSRRANRPFVAVNCAAIPETLIESELFGYRPGAFTGARREGMKGRIVRSHGGTLFLDEIGDMPLALQTRLLRVLEDREIVPLGSETPVKVDLHVIAASHRNLREMVERGAFRDDLYYRLNGITLDLPSLADRVDREHVIERVLRAEAGNGHPPAIEPEALRWLVSYPWPGNIRELRNVIRTALAMREDEVIRTIDLPSEIRRAARGSTPPGSTAKGPLRVAERAALLKAIESCHGNITRTAEQLGVSRNTLYRKMKRHGITAGRKADTVAA